MSNETLYISIYHQIQILYVPSAAREHIQHLVEVNAGLHCRSKTPYNYNRKIGCSIEDDSLSNTFQILPIRPLTRQIKFDNDSKLHTLFCCGSHTFVPLPRLPEQVTEKSLLGALAA